MNHEIHGMMGVGTKSQSGFGRVHAAITKKNLTDFSGPSPEVHTRLVWAEEGRLDNPNGK